MTLISLLKVDFSGAAAGLIAKPFSKNGAQCFVISVTGMLCYFSGM